MRAALDRAVTMSVSWSTFTCLVLAGLDTPKPAVASPTVARLRAAPGSLLLAQLCVTLERPPELGTHYWIGTVPQMWGHGQNWRLLSLSRCLM